MVEPANRLPVATSQAIAAGPGSSKWQSFRPLSARLPGVGILILVDDAMEPPGPGFGSTPLTSRLAPTR